MKAADNLVDLIYEIISQSDSKKDSTVLCEVAAKTDECHYDLYVVPDHSTIIHNIVNMTRFNLEIGDYCYVYKLNNNFSNSFICYKILSRNNYNDAISNLSDISVTEKELNNKIDNLSNNMLLNVKGYNGSKKQTLKNNNGILEWVDD